MHNCERRMRIRARTGCQKKIEFSSFFLSVLLSHFCLLLILFISYWSHIATVLAVCNVAASVKLTYLMSCMPLEYDWLAKWNHCVFACVSHFFPITISISDLYVHTDTYCVKCHSYGAIAKPNGNTGEKLIAFGSLTHTHTWLSFIC